MDTKKLQSECQKYGWLIVDHNKSSREYILINRDKDRMCKLHYIYSLENMEYIDKVKFTTVKLLYRTEEEYSGHHDGSPAGTFSQVKQFLNKE